MSRLGTFWEDRILPRVIEVTCSDRATGKWRHQALTPVAGDVLEVGFGSGTNLLHYTPAVTSVLAVEPSDLAWRRSEKARSRSTVRVERIGLDGAAIGVPDASVDAVVSTFTMCTIPDLTSALAEFQRVLRPGGSVHFVEHSLSPDADVARKQQRMQPRWGRLAGGCHLTRDIPTLIAGSGLEAVELDALYMPGPGFMRPFGWLTVGRAVPV